MGVRLFTIRLLTKHLVRFMTAEDVLRVVHRSIYFGESKLSDEEIGLLKEEAQAFKDSMLWKYMRRNIQYLANEKMTKTARNTDDIEYGLSMFYNLDIIEKFIDKFRSL